MTETSTVWNDATLAGGVPAAEGITVYGAPWCGDTRRSQALLRDLGMAFTNIDVDQDPAANAWVMAQQGGERRIPTIVLAAGERPLVEPSDAELRVALARTGYLAPEAVRAAD